MRIVHAPVIWHSERARLTIQPVFTESERLALAGFLAGYRGLTREAYTLDLRQFTAWCRTRPGPQRARAWNAGIALLLLPARAARS
jgi:hypothetical protein